MRKIVSKKKKAKKEKRNQAIIGVILIFVLLSSILGYAFQNKSDESGNTITYNGFEFTEQGDYWILNEENFIFSYNPEEVETVEGNVLELEEYYDNPLYIFSENDKAELEIYYNLYYYNQIVQRIQEGCPEDEICEKDIPTKTCEDNFIIIRESNSSRIYTQDNCVIIEGDQEDLVKLTDEFLFKTLGIRE